MPNTPRLSFIVLTDRPKALRLLLAALALQRLQDFEIVILNQGGSSEENEDLMREYQTELGVERVRMYSVARHNDWGQRVKADAAAMLATGEFVCFPNDDAYYVPQFVDRMLGTADMLAADLVYCDWLFDKYGYAVYRAQPAVGHIDVGGFIVRRDVLISHGWPDRSDVGDGRLIESLVRQGVKHARVPNVLYVKN